VIALRWELVAFAYYTYLLVMAFADRRFAGARVSALAGVIAGCVVLGAQSWLWPEFRVNKLAIASLVPLTVLLVGYWLSGRFFVNPMPLVESWLMDVDRRWLRRPGILPAYEASPAAVRESLEMAYLLVYLVIPAAVATLVIGGHFDALPRFWTVVLLAEFISYGAMPWVQTRSPRVIEQAVGMRHPQSVLRRFNTAILDRASVQANTIPSGHAAGAVATALVIVEVMPMAGIVFLVLAVAIVAATVLGRYHYLVDALLGTVVAASAWYFCR